MVENGGNGLPLADFASRSADSGARSRASNPTDRLSRDVHFISGLIAHKVPFASQSLHPQMEAQASRRRRQLGGGRRTLVHLHAPTAEPMAHHQCNRAGARRVQAKDQDANRAAVSRHRSQLFWALLASGRINMQKVDGWQTLAVKPSNQPIDLVA